PARAASGRGRDRGPQRGRAGVPRDARPRGPAGSGELRSTKMDILILGVNGFIGSHLTAEILEKTDWTVHGMDLESDRIGRWEGHKRFRFLEGDIDINHEWIAY